VNVPEKTNDDGRAYVAGWIIKLLAGSFLVASLAWADWVTKTNNEHATTIVKVETKQEAFSNQLNRIEAKLDRVLESKAKE
jgi:hypothetical protein